MKDLLTLLDEYLATRRALGAGLVQAERLLRSFLAFLGRHEVACMTTQLALQWATEPSQAQPAWQAQRLGVVRAFARYASAADPRHEVPPEGLLTAQYRRATPYIYSDQEIADLIAAAQRLRGITALRAGTSSRLLARLAVTGMRSSEPLRLDRVDVDLASGVLTVRHAKFG
ncbi:MAG: integrase, partial [Acidobacteria bacterium]|nr:integrase [Acidobacteriota bacterium]